MKSKGVLLLALLLAVTTWGLAHPHLSKTVSVMMEGSKATVSFFTAPANEDRLANIENGSYNRSTATLELEGDQAVVEAGKYSVGAIKNGDSDWTLCLYNGQLGRGESADMSKVIKLDSHYSNSMGQSDHVEFNLEAGGSDLEGRVVLVWRFGSHYLAGGLSKN